MEYEFKECEHVLNFKREWVLRCPECKNYKRNKTGIVCNNTIKTINGKIVKCCYNK